jgi:arylsulfatase A-like enzyme
MRHPRAVRRVIVVVMDALRPDAIDAFDLSHLRHLVRCGAATLTATTVEPSVTAAAMTSLLTGVPPEVHGLQSDRFHIPRTRGPVMPLPRALAAAGYPSTALMAEIPLIFRPVARQIVASLGVGESRFAGRDSAGVLLAAQRSLVSQRRGLIIMHWPDADRAGHAHGWMSHEYGEAARRMDRALGLLLDAHDILSDPSTVLVVLADHGGGGAVLNDHESAHRHDITIPIVFAGGSVTPGALTPDCTLLDVPATILWMLGVRPPVSYAGRVLSEAFEAIAPAGDVGVA